MTTNTLITGIPRSGTTLLTSLLAKHSEAVVFSEPEWLKGLRAEATDSGQFVPAFLNHLQTLRGDIQQGRPVHLKQSKVTQGLPSNYYLRDAQGQVTSDKQEVALVLPDALSTAPFIVKANAQFTACLAELCAQPELHIIAVVRNPIAAIMSWRSLDLPVSHGRMKIAEKYAPDFAAFIAHEELMVKQVLIADWFFRQYQTHQEQVVVLRYEDLVTDATAHLQAVYPAGHYADLEPLKSQNQNPHYPLEEQRAIHRCLLDHGQYFAHFYPELTSAP